MRVKFLKSRRLSPSHSTPIAVLRSIYMYICNCMSRCPFVTLVPDEGETASYTNRGLAITILSPLKKTTEKLTTRGYFSLATLS